MAFIRQRMMGFRGDPFVGTSPTMIATVKRKMAAAGTKRKAERHRLVRVLRQQRIMGDPFLGMAPPSAAKSKAQAALGAGFAGFANMAKSALKKLAPMAKGALGSGLFGPAGTIASGFLPGFDTPGPKTRPPASFGPMPGAPDLGGFGGGGGGGGGGSRRMNPANVKALRRGIRRMQGFNKLVKSVNRLLPPAARHKVASVPKRKRR